MYRIGIDVGSTYTKYCVMRDGAIEKMWVEDTPIRQIEYFEKKREELLAIYKGADFCACGYGRKNASAIEVINELTALGKGVEFIRPKTEIVLDIGGQDTKLLVLKDGHIEKFFLNEKCAAGCGMFYKNVVNMLKLDYDDIDVSSDNILPTRLNSTCAVFAQSEMVRLISENVDINEIVKGVIYHILNQSKMLLSKIKIGKEVPIVISGGMASVKGIDKMATEVLGVKCVHLEESRYLSAIGCCIK